LFDVPAGIELREGPILQCREAREDGRIVGELELSVFAAALIIDRDGILAEKAREAASRELGGRGAHDAVAVRLPGATGYRSDGVHSARLPYVYAFTFAPSDLGVDGGVLVIMRAASPDWPAGEQMLSSLRLLRRNGTVEEPAELEDDSAYDTLLPVVASGR
jgi:hypothetical protein